MSEITTELVLGLPRAAVPGGLDFRGVRPIGTHGRRGVGGIRDLSRTLELFKAIERHGTFRPRPEAEIDLLWKQVIPYLLLRSNDQVFLMKRTKAGADERLHDRYSIGIGGHVNPADGDINMALIREWEEEIDADFMPDHGPIGVLNDDSNDVGAVHLGIVFEGNAQGRPVAIREKDKLSGEFATLDEVAAVAERLETWSALLLDFLMANEDRAALGR